MRRDRLRDETRTTLFGLKDGNTAHIDDEQPSNRPRQDRLRSGTYRAPLGVLQTQTLKPSSQVSFIVYVLKKDMGVCALGCGSSSISRPRLSLHIYGMAWMFAERPNPIIEHSCA